MSSDVTPIAEVIVDLVRGMWALNSSNNFGGCSDSRLWDKRRRRLVLARDPLGEKPLYVRRERQATFIWIRN